MTNIDEIPSTQNKLSKVGMESWVSWGMAREAGIGPQARPAGFGLGESISVYHDR